MTQQEVINYLAKVLFPRDEMDSAAVRTVYNQLTTGLQVLANCAEVWNSSNNSVSIARKRITYNLSRIPEYNQLCATFVIEKLLGRNDWVSYDEELVELGEFEISATLWLLKVGVYQLALARVHPPRGRSAIEVALACEQEWLLNHTSEEEQAQICGFAADLKLWAFNLEVMGDEVDEEEQEE